MSELKRKAIYSPWCEDSLYPDWFSFDFIGFFGNAKYLLVQTKYLFKFFDFISYNQERRTRNFELSSYFEDWQIKS